MSYIPKDHSKDVWKELGEKSLRVSDKMLGHLPTLIIGFQAVTNLVLVVMVFILLLGYFK
jgi:hypothetical protein